MDTSSSIGNSGLLDNSRESTDSGISTLLQKLRSPYLSLAMLVGGGIFVSTISQTGQLGLYPFRFLLKNKLGEGPLRIALFIQLSAMPWNLKIIAGIIADSIPFLGTRRRHYLLFSSLAAGLLWLAVALVPPRYTPLVLMATLMNIALVFVSTVSGGLLVEGGRKFGATGNLNALRVFIMNMASLGIPLGAFLASRAFGYAALAAAIPLFLLFFFALFFHKEEASPQRDEKVLTGMWSQLKVVFQSKTLWAAASLLFLIQFAPGFNTPLMFYQTDTLHFSERFIGTLTFVDAIAGASGAFFYAFFCRRFPLRALLYGSIFVTAALSLLYLGYNDQRSALIIEAIYCFVYALAQLPLFDLAARATPKGSEALGYSIIMSVWNWGLFFSDIIGSALFEKFHLTFKSLVWANSATTALALLAVPLLPKILMDPQNQSAQKP
jgi:hypothetical protein